MTKQHHPKAQPRRCHECGKGFRPMTDALWGWNFRVHRKLSKRHSRTLAVREEDHVVRPL